MTCSVGFLRRILGQKPRIQPQANLINDEDSEELGLNEHTAWLYHDPGYYLLFRLRTFERPRNLVYRIKMTTDHSHRTFPVPAPILARIPSDRVPVDATQLTDNQRDRARQFYHELDQLLDSLRDEDPPLFARVHMNVIYELAEKAADDIMRLQQPPIT